MAQRLSQGISVTGGAGQRIGNPAGGDDHRPAGVKAALPLHAGEDLTLPSQGAGPVLHNVHPGPTQGQQQGVDDVSGFVGAGKDPVPPLCFQRYSQALKKRLHRLRGKAGDGAGEEPAVAWDILQHLRRRTVVGHVAAALSGDVELAPQLGIALQQGDGCTLLGGGDGGHTAGRTAADDNYMLQVISSTFS